MVGKAFAKKDTEYNKIRQNSRLQKQKKAVKLMNKVGMVIKENGAGIQELQKFQQHLKKYKITVYKYGTKGTDLIF